MVKNTLMTDETMIKAAGIEKEVAIGSDTLQILKPAHLSIKRGDSVAIVGTSGSGKSTLLGLLAGLDLPSGGEIELAGNLITAMTEDERAQVRAQYVGFVFQSFQLMPNLTAIENVMLPLELLDSANERERAENMLERVGLQARLDHYPRQLSGGEQQRVALARAFVTEPAILFADEPTGNLDTKTGSHIADLLFQLNQERQTTLVLVTHDVKLAERCHQVVTLEAGAVVAGAVIAGDAAEVTS